MGRWVAKLKVVRLDDTGEVPGWRRAAIRTLGLAPWSWVPARYLPPRAWATYGLHDRMAGTVVVEDDPDG